MTATSPVPQRRADDVTLGEIARRVDALHTAVDNGLAGVHQRLDVADALYVRKETLEVALGAVRADLTRLEGRAESARQLALGGLAYPLIVALVVALVAAAAR